MKKREEFSGLKWETHCHSVYSNRRRRWFDALNTPREMIESAIRRGLDGMIITDHDTVKGGLAGKKIARGYNGFHVIPGAEVSSMAGHILAIGIEENIPKGLSLEESVDRIHDFGGVAVASHPFSNRVRPSLGEESLKTDGVEVFNAMNRVHDNSKALALARSHMQATTAGSDAHWAQAIGSAGIICDDPLEDIVRGRATLFGSYTSILDVQVFHFRQLVSALANRRM